MALIEGTFQGKLVSGTAKIGDRKGKTLAVAQLEVTEGDHKGKRFNYEGGLHAEGIKYTKRDLMALGWKGQTIKSLELDTEAALKAGLTVPFVVEIARWEKPDGTVKEWNAVRSIGNSAPTLDAIDGDKQRNVDRWFAEAGDVGAPQANGANGAARQDDIPF